jgi:hypothetical protein
LASITLARGHTLFKSLPAAPLDPHCKQQVFSHLPSRLPTGNRTNLTPSTSPITLKSFSQWPLFIVSTLLGPSRKLTSCQRHVLSSSISQAQKQLECLTVLDLPPVKPSAIALGIVFNQASTLAVLAPLFGDTYHRYKAADSKEEFAKSRETATAAASWGSSIVGSAVQTYGVAALINATGTLTYKGAAYLGTLIFFASTAPSVGFAKSKL